MLKDMTIQKTFYNQETQKPNCHEHCMTEQCI